MKISRHNRILELISEYPISRQDKLLELLKEDGYEVTQSTISRDISRLGLVKLPNNDGVYCYQAPSMISKNARNTFRSLFSDTVISVKLAKNLIVIKTEVGMANAVCASLDAMEYEEIVGTLAGDDTIFVACREDNVAQRYATQFNEIISK